MQSASITRFAIAATTLGLVACTSFVILPADVYIVPTKYPLAANDVREIQRLPGTVGIKQSLKYMQARNANEVSVTCGAPEAEYGELVFFTARRQNGQWVVDRSSIQRSKNKEDRVIVE
jgi:hypothetical protein